MAYFLGLLAALQNLHPRLFSTSRQTDLDETLENRFRSNKLTLIFNILKNGTVPCLRDFFSAQNDNNNVTDKIYTDRELALNYLNFCVPVLTSFHAPRKLLWRVSLVVFSVKSIGKTPFESTKINIFAKLLHRSSFWDSNLKGK